MATEPLSPEEKDAAREEIGQRVLETIAELEQALKGDTSSSASRKNDPGLLLYQKVDVHERALAAFLEELIDIALPELKLVTQSIRETFAVRPDNTIVSPAEIEALAGPAVARSRKAEWLDVPSLRLDAGMTGIGFPTKHTDGDHGLCGGCALFVLADGRLVTVETVGLWRVAGNQLGMQHSIINSSVISALEAVRTFPFPFMVSSLRSQLRLDYKFLEGQHAPDLAERQTRFDSILLEYAKLLEAHAEGLRRVGDNPA